MIYISRISKTTLFGAVLAAAVLFVPGRVLAINVCGDGICQAGGIPPETPQTCPADCGFCGDGICGIPENCSVCISDCGSSCLSFTLSSELKKSGCAGDDDNDCLDNAKENDLAWIAAPYYYYDESEGCSGAWYTDGPNALHYGRRDFFQVRPVGAVTQWTPSSRDVKTVQITYFLLHPHDCHSTVGFGGHQGDSEHVVFKLSSQNLKKWYLVSGVFYHHGQNHTFTGPYLRARASEIGTASPNVAADEDSHGSWPGEKGSKSACAGSEDDIGPCRLGRCDCFRGTMKEAFDAGYRETLSASRNIGGPPNKYGQRDERPGELWRPSVVSVSGRNAWSVFDVGHGSNREYWTIRADRWKKFCGWECSARASSGDCLSSHHKDTECTSPLSEKLDTVEFTPPSAIAAPLAAADGQRGVPAPGTDQAETGRLRAGLAVAVDAVVSPEQAEAFRRRLEDAADPVVALVPMLESRTREQQAETLAWMLATGREKLAAALSPDLFRPDRLTPTERETAAVKLLGVAASLLEAEGYAAPDLDRGTGQDTDHCLE
jgi:hypothetical protein